MRSELPNRCSRAADLKQIGDAGELLMAAELTVQFQGVQRVPTRQSLGEVAGFLFIN